MVACSTVCLKKHRRFRPPGSGSPPPPPLPPPPPVAVAPEILLAGIEEAAKALTEQAEAKRETAAAKDDVMQHVEEAARQRQALADAKREIAEVSAATLGLATTVAVTLTVERCREQERAERTTLEPTTVVLSAENVHDGPHALSQPPASPAVLCSPALETDPPQLQDCKQDSEQEEDASARRRYAEITHQGMAFSVELSAAGGADEANLLGRELKALVPSSWRCREEEGAVTQRTIVGMGEAHRLSLSVGERMVVEYGGAACFVSTSLIGLSCDCCRDSTETVAVNRRAGCKRRRRS